MDASEGGLYGLTSSLSSVPKPYPQISPKSSLGSVKSPELSQFVFLCKKPSLYGNWMCLLLQTSETIWRAAPFEVGIGGPLTQGMPFGSCILRGNHEKLHSHLLDKFFHACIKFLRRNNFLLPALPPPPSTVTTHSSSWEAEKAGDKRRKRDILWNHSVNSSKYPDHGPFWSSSFCQSSFW